MEEEVFEETTLLDGRVRLFQPREGYRAAIDPVLLAAAIPARPGDLLAELGMGSGAAAFCLAARVTECRIIGLELQPEMIDAARLGIAANQLEDRVEIHPGTIEKPPTAFPPEGFDHVFFNPPYNDPADGTLPPLPSRRTAHAETARLTDWIAAARALLRHKGRLSMIHRADRLDGILAALGPGFGGVEIFPLWPKAGNAAKRIIVRARKGVRSPLILHPGLILHGGDGKFTPETQAVLRDGQELWR